MKKELLACLFMLMFVILSTGCKKEKNNAVDTEFCAFISKKDYNGTAPLINDYLKGQSDGLTESQKLNQLKDWLNSKSCVAGVEILCTSCIYTLPAQSELKVTFIIEGKLAENTLDIIMEKPLRFGTFHIK